MKIDYSSWTSRRLSIENLKLDAKNPRFSYQSIKEMNQTEIVKYLVDNHNVYELAKAIAVNGYLLNEEPIVCKEGEHYVVLEGNRRVAACKILLNPYKYLTPQKAKELSRYESIDDKMSCYVAPTRREADALIYNKHTGIPLQKWDKVSQDAFLVNLLKSDSLTPEQVALKWSVPISDIRKALRRYEIHQYSIKLFKDEPYELEQIQQQGFPITNFERFYDDSRGLDFLGISFGSNGEILKRLPSEEFDKRFRFIVKQILEQELTSRTFNNDRDKEEYFAHIKNFDKSSFDLSVQASDNVMEENCSNGDASENNQEDKTVTSERPKKSGRRKSGLFADFDWGDTGISKMDSLFNTIKEVSYKKHADVIGIALRCYIDMMVYEFLKAKKCLGILLQEDSENTKAHNDKKFGELKAYLNSTYGLSDVDIDDDELREKTKFKSGGKENKIPELGTMINYIIKHPDLFDHNTRLIQVLETFKSSNSKFITLSSCNMFVHNQYFSASSTSLEDSISNLAPVLEAMYKTIKDE